MHLQFALIKRWSVFLSTLKKAVLKNLLQHFIHNNFPESHRNLINLNFVVNVDVKTIQSIAHLLLFKRLQLTNTISSEYLFVLFPHSTYATSKYPQQHRRRLMKMLESTLFQRESWKCTKRIISNKWIKLSLLNRNNSLQCSCEPQLIELNQNFKSKQQI